MAEDLKPAHRAALDVAIEDLDAAATPSKSEVFTACGPHAADLRDAIKAALAIIEEARRAPAPEPVKAEGERVSRVTVQEVEMVSYDNGFRQTAPSIWRIEIGGYCADFETENLHSAGLGPMPEGVIITKARGKFRREPKEHKVVSRG